MRVDVDDHVRPLASDRRSVRRGEPRATHLAERIRPSLRRRAQVLHPITRPCVLHGPQRRDERLAGLGIEIAVDADHPMDRGRHVQAPTLEPLVLLALGEPGIDGLSPVRQDHPQLGERQRPCGVHERLLGGAERVLAPLARSNELVDRRGRHVAAHQGLGGERHGLERPRDPDPRRGRSERQPVPVREPRRGRQVSVERMHAPTLELDQPAGALGLDHAGGAFELVDVRYQVGVAREPEVVRAELVEGGPERAHPSTLRVCIAARCELAHTSRVIPASRSGDIR
jgi:hypothetical protein